MNNDSKPLIFLEPLSQTLKKLKDALEENAEAEGIEIYDVETIEEASQLIPTIGQAVILTASPKTCAQMLQSNRKYIKKLKTKTLLLTPKSIPRKTLDKFTKVGLTECIVEPVNPKTLLYKVRLQLRSIVAKKTKEKEINEEVNEDSSSRAVDTQKKMRPEKGVIPDDEENPEFKNRVEKGLILEDEENPEFKNRVEKGVILEDEETKKEKEEVELDYEDNSKLKKQGYQEEAIDSHYKGKIKKEESLEEESPPEKTTKDDIEFEEDIEAMKRKINLEVEEDYNKKKRKEIHEDPIQENLKKKTSLNVEEESEDDEIRTREEEDLGGHYKGKLNQNDLDVEDDLEDEIAQEREAEDFQNMKGKSSASLNIEEDNDEEYLDKEEKPEEIISKKKHSTSMSEEEEEIDDLARPKLNIIEDEEEKNHLREEDEYEEVKRKKDSSLDIEDDEEQDAVDDKKVDDIDGYLRGGKAKKDLDIEDDLEDLYKNEKAEAEKEKNRKEMAALDLYDDDPEKDPLLGENEYDTDESKKKKSAQLNIANDEFTKKDKNDQQEEDDFERAHSNYQEDEGGGFGKKHSAHTQKEEERHNKSNARADHIKTHYSSRESIKHNEGDWDSNWEKAGVAEQEFGSYKKEDELNYEKEDLGEQTIDYTQLKKEFEGIDVSETIKKKKEYAEFDQIAQVNTYTKSILSPTGTLERMEFEEVKVETQDEDESHQVYLPDSKGMEIVIEILNFYQKDKIQLSSIFNFISMKINDQFNGDLTLYIVNEKNELNLFHSGSVIRLLGIAPQSPKEEDTLDKKEYKLLIKEFKEEDREYKVNTLTIQSEWKQKWEIRLDQWKSCKTPKWHDHTFQEEDNEFIFPFYEGVSLLGLALFTPNENFIVARSGALEVALESLRAPILTRYHEERGLGQQRTKVTKQSVNKSNSKSSKGFFSKLFGKKAG